MTGMNVDNSRLPLPLIRTSQHRLFDNMNRMFNPIKSPTITLTPHCPHITLWDCLPYFATTTDYGNFLSNKKAFQDTIFGITKSLQMMQTRRARYPCHWTTQKISFKMIFSTSFIVFCFPLLWDIIMGRLTNKLQFYLHQFLLSCRYLTIKGTVLFFWLQNLSFRLIF